MAETLNKKTPRDVLRVIFRRRRLFLLGASLFAIIAMLGAHYLPVKYTGTTIFEHRKDVAAERTLERGSESFDATRLSMQNDLASRDAVAEVAEEIALLKGLPRDSEGRLTRDGEMAKQRIVGDIIKNVKVALMIRSTNMDRFSVSVTHHDPILAKQIPNTLVKNYKNRLLQAIKGRLTSSSKFLVDQVAECESRLTEITNERIEFETKHAGMMPESPGALYENLQRINNDLETLAKQQTADRLKIARLKTQLDALGKPPAMPEPTSHLTSRPSSQPTTQPSSLPTSQPVEWVDELNPEKKRLEDQLQEFKEQLNSALTIGHMKEKHPTVKTLRAKIEELEKRFEAEPEWITVRKTVGAAGNSVARQLTAQMIFADVAAAVSELEAGAKEIERLQKQREKLQVLMANFAPVRQQYEQIVEKVKKQAVERDGWRKQLAEVQMALDAEDEGRRTHLNVLQVAQEQILPSSPKLFMVLGFAIIGGLAFGGGVVLASSHWDRSISTTDDAIKYFDVPVFGITSEIVSGRQRLVRHLRRWVIGPIVTIIVLAGLAASGLSVTLWLKYPQKHEEWKASPIMFVSGAVTGFARDVSKFF
ncbi:MAG: hypothetical protein SVV80_03385 [Planctomycetota bacterium]|nr:hypothetical protein [Planctomycetota bacterium]